VWVAAVLRRTDPYVSVSLGLAKAAVASNPRSRCSFGRGLRDGSRLCPRIFGSFLDVRRGCEAYRSRDVAAADTTPVCKVRSPAWSWQSSPSRFTARSQPAAANCSNKGAIWRS
jgi:hypothetical protein